MIATTTISRRMTSVRVGRQKSQTEELQCTSSLTRHEPNKQQEQYDMLFINDYFVYRFVVPPNWILAVGVDELLKL